MDEYYGLKIKALWSGFWSEKFSFWMICGYLFFEYVRPQSIVPAIDILPWGKIFVVGAIVGAFTAKEVSWVKDPANKWIISFLAVILIAGEMAVYPSVSRQHYFDYFQWVMVYFLIITIVNTERRFLIFILIFIVASFKLSAFGAKTWTMRGFAFTDWGLMGPSGFFQNSGELAIQMLMFLPLGYELSLVCRPYISKNLYLFLLLLPVTAAMTVMGASSRGAQIGLLFQVYVLFLKNNISIRTLLLVAAIVCAVWTLIPEEQKARFASTGSDKTSQQRLLYWKHGWDMIQENPVLGVGFFNFAPVYDAHFSSDALYGSAQLPHNIFIQVGTDCGFTGVIIFVMIIYGNMRANSSTRKLSASLPLPHPMAKISSGLDAALWGFVIAGQFVTVTYYPFLWVNLALSVALRNIVQKNIPPKNRKNVGDYF